MSFFLKFCKKLTLLMFFSSVHFSVNATMFIHDLYPKHWKHSRYACGVVPTEEEALLLLRQNPLEIDEDIEYICFPYTPWFFRRLEKDICVQTSNGFSVSHQLDFEQAIPILKQMGVTTLFASHATTKIRDDDFRVIAFPLKPYQKIDPATDKDIFCSFVGTSCSHPIRAKLKETLTDPKFLIILSDGEWWFNIQSRKDKNFRGQHYCDVMSRSRYALCPRGTGPNSIRFWEALRAGAIPILIADDLALPTNVEWEECIVRVREDSIESIPVILEGISPEQESRMREKCFEASRKTSGPNLVSIIRDHYKKQE